MKLFLALLVGAVALLALAGCGGNGSSSSGSAGSNGSGVNTIGVNNQAAGFPWAFQSPVTVKSGSKVQWMNNTGMEHGITWETVVPNTSPAPSAPTVPNFAPGATSAIFTMPTVTTQTTYNYICTIHGNNMPGQVIVTP